MAENNQAVKVEHAYLPPVRHPIKAARLLYSAPSWVLRGPIYLVGVICIVTLVYSFWAKKDELVIGPLKLEREAVTMEAVDAGMVARVMVHEGDRVDSLTPLLEVQKTRVTNESEQAGLQAKRDELEKSITNQTEEFEHKNRQFDLSLKQLELSLNNMDKERTLLLQNLESAKRTVAHAEGKLAEARKNLAVEENLFRNKDITKAEYDRAKNLANDLEKQTLDAKANVDAIQVNLNAFNKEKIKNDIVQIQNEKTQLKNRYDNEIERSTAQINKLKKQIDDSEKLVHGVSHEGTTTNYTATFPGLVTQVHVKPGHMINPGSPLVTTVKDSAALEARVLVQNKDIGRLRKEQRVQIKYFAYPYQEFGIPVGLISDIGTKPGEIKGQESMYVVRVALESETISKLNSRPKRLEIGLEGIAEIKVGEKRFIELAFSPISRFFTQEE
ncbi:MAG: HlyD family efflux transporter periplasmic adaptor subunit [Magnetococcales bacterium]|nr:HlyD family efflux transporter periplasmic adaptor subunit [Magnetococcales bacterium]NGZ26668.1 HlyD family efflux transporter periplasmic adaptor subunit [Magnetococcales bacterium]